MTVFPDWREPVARLRVEHGPPTEEQRQLAAQVGLKLRGDEPRPIVAAMLRDALADPLELRPFEAASERQYEYLRTLSGEGLPGPLPAKPSYMLTSAWIRHLLGGQTADALERLQLRRGDLVFLTRKLWDPFASDDEQPTADETHVVSSISETGKVNFKKTEQQVRAFEGPRISAWPTKLTLIARAEDFDSAPKLPRAARRVKPLTAPAPDLSERFDGKPTLAMLKLWGRVLLGLQYQREARTLWSRLSDGDPGRAKLTCAHAQEVLERMMGSAGTEAEVAIVFSEQPEGVRVWLYSRGPRSPAELLPAYRGEEATADVFLPGSPDAVVADVLAQVCSAQEAGDPDHP